MLCYFYNDQFLLSQQQNTEAQPTSKRKNYFETILLINASMHFPFSYFSIRVSVLLFFMYPLSSISFLFFRIKRFYLVEFRVYCAAKFFTFIRFSLPVSFIFFYPSHSFRSVKIQANPL